MKYIHNPKYVTETNATLVVASGSYFQLRCVL